MQGDQFSGSESIGPGKVCRAGGLFDLEVIWFQCRSTPVLRKNDQGMTKKDYKEKRQESWHDTPLSFLNKRIVVC
jgi:hypothetical protein